NEPIGCAASVVNAPGKHPDIKYRQEPDTTYLHPAKDGTYGLSRATSPHRTCVSSTDRAGCYRFMPTSMMPFTAPRLLAHPDVQTVLSAVPVFAPRRAIAGAVAEALRFPIGEGELFAQAWWQPGGSARPTTLVVHGVGGSSESSYALRAAVAL